MKDNMTYISNPLIAIAVIAMLITTSSKADTVLDFEGLPVGAGGFYNGDIDAGSPLRDNYTVTGTGLAFGSVETRQLWSTGGASFNNNYIKDFGSWSGWVLSNVQDPTTPGFGNQYASRPGGGSNGAGGINSGNYAVASASGSSVFFNLPSSTIALSARIANTTYAALSIQDGDAFAKKFGGVSGNDPDFFSATFTGFDALAGTGATTGSREVFLADYRFANNAQDFLLSNWLNVDLTSLGSAKSIGITFASSDAGAFGINTPTYLAFDDLVVTAVPEPSSLAVFGAVALLGAWKSRRRFRMPQANQKSLPVNDESLA